MSDLVKRLRDGEFTCDAKEAAILADRIEQLERENAELRAEVDRVKGCLV